jgi:hypothetical protein
MARRRGPLTVEEITELRLGPAHDRAPQFATAEDRAEALERLAETDATPDAYMYELIRGGNVLAEARRRHEAHDGYGVPATDALDCRKCNPAGYVPGWMTTEAVAS